MLGKSRKKFDIKNISLGEQNALPSFKVKKNSKDDFIIKDLGNISLMKIIVFIKLLISNRLIFLHFVEIKASLNS